MSDLIFSENKIKKDNSVFSTAAMIGLLRNDCFSHIWHKASLADMWKQEAQNNLCVEVLWPTQPNGVMLSTNSLPNHTFTGQAKSSKWLTSIVHILRKKLTTALFESAEGREWQKKIFHD